MAKNKDKGASLPLIFGIIYCVIYIITRITAGSAYNFLHKISGVNIFSPLWLFSVFSALAFFLGGYYLGCQIKSPCSCPKGCTNRADLYKGGILFTIVFFLSLMWYPTLFIRESVVLGFFIALICFVLCVAVIYIWSRVKVCGLIFGTLFSIWWLYVTILNFLLIFKI